MIKRLAIPIAAVCIILFSFIGCTATDVLAPSNGSIRPGSEVAGGEYALPGEAVTGFPPSETEPTLSPTPTPKPERGEMRAVWVATVLNLDFPLQTDLTAAALMRHIDAIVANTVEMGLNAIIFQARPAGDAFYDSDIFPWSYWLSGEQGVGVSGFDPLEYWIEACRANGIELHAWLNPYRIIHTSSNSSDPGTLSPDNPVRQNPELAVAWSTSDGRRGLFLDPGLPEAQQLIIDGIVELIEKYDVDGIHFDDYFYPGTDFDDAATYERYGGGMALDDWRRENVNNLIRGIQEAIREHNKATGKDILWGISPTAIWKNQTSDPLGIPTTRGQESYHAMYADTRRWVAEGWVDYICPQIYWYIGFDIADFEAIFNWWGELCAGTGVDLYVGHAAYREFQGDQPPNWEGEMARQLEMMDAAGTAKGSMFFRYGSLLGSVGASIRDYYVEKDGKPPREPVMAVEKLSVGFPANDTSITGTPSNRPGYNIVGASIPGLPLYLNGVEVTGRTVEGFFHVFPPLVTGDNVFTFSQDGQEDVTRVITLRAPTGGGGGGTQQLPSVTRVTELDYATVTSNEAWLYTANSTDQGYNIYYMLTPGQRDRIVARSGSDMVRLSCGAWIRSNAVTVEREGAAIADVLSGGTYRSFDDADYVVWKGSVFPAAVATFEDSKLTVSFGMHSAAPALELPAGLNGTMFSAARSGVSDDVPFWEFTIRDDVKLEGYYIDFENGEFRLQLKKRKTLSDGALPLKSISFVLDAGHGGTAYGTTAGPLGAAASEKDLVLTQTLKLAERLERLGATVALTRDSDADISLQGRVDVSREAMPDMFISLHINSIDESANARGVRGFTVWYQKPVCLPLTEAARDVLQYINPGTNRARVINHANFFVCRPWWSPHVLFEASYMPNIDDFVWLIDERQQDRYADATVDMILEYFGG